MEKKRGNKRLVLLWALMAAAAVCVVIAVLSLIASAKEAAARKAAADALYSAAVTAMPTSAPTQAPAEAPLPTPAPTPEPAPNYPAWAAPYAQIPDKKIDFEALRAVNPDIAAWITVPGTAVDYPVAFAAKGDLTYLTHDVSLKESKAGAIYYDGYNNSDLSDPLTLIYGHNMKDGSMFASLHQFENAAFFEENTSFYIYMEDYMLEYEIISAYSTGDTHLLAINDFSDPAVFQRYLADIPAVRDMNAKLRERPLEPGDRLVALVTCIQGKDHLRYFVQGVLKEK